MFQGLSSFEFISSCVFFTTVQGDRDKELTQTKNTMTIDLLTFDLQRTQCFKRYSVECLQPLAKRSSIRALRKNTIICMDGDILQSVYFILKGTVRVFKENQQGKEVTLYKLGQGESFGETAWLNDGKQFASVITKEPCNILTIQHADFSQFYADHPDFMHCIATRLSSEIANISQHLKEIALGSIHQRVLWALRNNAQEVAGKKVANFATHRELASLIGCSRESVSRTIQDLKKSGDVTLDGDTIYLQT